MHSFLTPRRVALSLGRTGGGLGFAGMLARLWRRVVKERRLEPASVDTRNSPPNQSFNTGGIPVRLANTRRGPAVTGILRAQIAPQLGIDRLLSERELNSVLIHELTHARRRDNLIRSGLRAGAVRIMVSIPWCG